MALPREAYRMLEDIVGPENVSEDEAITECYAFNATCGAGSAYWTRPAAVILPQTVEEVQAIVKVCNRFKIGFKAHSTGWCAWGNVSRDNSILIDLRRMNRILEIDVKNQYAVVEPYVTGGQLQAELMKVGYDCCIVGAGANASILAGCTSCWGWGFNSFGYSIHARNLLAMEWVTPTGEIVRTGSLSCGAGWFCGDGPGPSIRGLVRGQGGPLGGLGIFTKCATKIYHWPGPREIQIDGRAPNYVLAKPVENMAICTVVFPTWENFVNALYKIGDAEIAFSVSRYGLFDAVLSATGSAKEAYELWKTGKFLPERRGPSLIVGVRGDSRAEVEWKLKVLEDIAKEESGVISGGIADPDIQRRRQFGYIKIDRPAVTFRPSQLGSSMGSQGAHDMVMKQIQIGAEWKRPYIEKGQLLDDAGDNAYMMDIEGGAFSHVEELFHIDPCDPGSVKGGIEFIETITSEVPAKYHFSLPSLGIYFTPQIARKYGEMCYNFHLWQQRIKQSLDPDNLSDPSHYLLGVTKEGET